MVLDAALSYASEELKKDPAVVLAAVKQDDEALYYALGKAEEDPKVV